MSIDYLVNRTLDYIIFKHFNLWSEKKINNDQLIIRNYIKKIILLIFLLGKIL